MHRNGRMWKLEALTGKAVVLALAAILVLGAIMPAQASSGPTLISPTSSPYGTSFGQWSAEWWQWALKQTTFDPCPSHQSGPVWFLYGTDGGHTYTCTVPRDTALLIPIINAEWSVAEGPCPITISSTLSGEDYLRACAKAQMDYVQHLSVIVDGVKLIEASATNSPYRVDSDLFTFIAARNNVFAVPQGPSQSVADGFYAMLAPLTPGTHIVQFVGKANFTGAFTGGGLYRPGGTYNITVQ